MQLQNNTILITGGASGIGKAMAARFRALNNTVIVCGRRTDLLEKLQNEIPGVIAFHCDLEQADQRAALFEFIKSNHPQTNVLVNNAGIQNWMKLDDEDFIKRAEQEIAINIQAPIHLTTLFSSLTSLNTILNVSSGLAFCPLTKTPVYSATKAFLRSFTLSSRALLAPRGIEVIEIIPPALNTDLGGVGLHDHAPPVADFIEAMFKQLEEGASEVTFGFSAAMLAATPDQIRANFQRMNGQ